MRFLPRRKQQPAANVQTATEREVNPVPRFDPPPDLPSFAELHALFDAAKEEAREIGRRLRNGFADGAFHQEDERG